MTSRQRPVPLPGTDCAGVLCSEADAGTGVAAGADRGDGFPCGADPGTGAETAAGAGIVGEFYGAPCLCDSI